MSDGLGLNATTSYLYDGGMWDPVRREFRGFNTVQITDPVGVVKRIFFHQGGGYDDSAIGEWMDQGAFAKKGIPYRTEI